jgi:hypothetical protein
VNKTKLRSFGVIEKPREGEYPDYAHIYVDLLPDDGLILKHLANNLNTTRRVVLSIPKEALACPAHGSI